MSSVGLVLHEKKKGRQAYLVPVVRCPMDTFDAALHSYS